MFRGNYHGKQSHVDDFDRVMERARKAGVVAQIVTGGSLTESLEAQKLCDKGERTTSRVARGQEPKLLLNIISI